MDNIDLTVILVIGKNTERALKNLDRLLGSIEKQKVKPKELMVVSPSTISPRDIIIEDLFINNGIIITYKEIDSHEMETCADFISFAVNTVLDGISTKYISILDENIYWSESWLYRIKEYMELEKEKSVYLPITNMVNDKGDWLSFSGEIYYNVGVYVSLGEKARELGLELGDVTLDTLKNYGEINTLGGIWNTADIKEAGGVKTNIKLFAFYELLMRMAKMGYKIFVLPKSLVYRNFVLPEIDVKEAKEWFTYCVDGM